MVTSNSVKGRLGWASTTLVLLLTTVVVVVVAQPAAAYSVANDASTSVVRVCAGVGAISSFSRSIGTVLEGASEVGNGTEDGGDATTGNSGAGMLASWFPSGFPLVFVVVILAALVFASFALLKCCRAFFAHMRDFFQSCMNSLSVDFSVSFGDRDRYTRVTATADGIELDTVTVEEV